MSKNVSTIYVILEGIESKQLRFVVAYRDFQEACTFCRTALNQALNALPVRHTIQQQKRNHGHTFDLIRDSDLQTVATYVVQKTNVV